MAAENGSGFFRSWNKRRLILNVDFHPWLSLCGSHILPRIPHSPPDWVWMQFTFRTQFFIKLFSCGCSKYLFCNWQTRRSKLYIACFDFFVKIGAHSRRCLPSCGSRLPSVRYTHRGLPTAAPTIFSLYPPQTAVENVASFAKSHARLACSVVNALTTAHSRYQLFASYEGSTPTAQMPKKSFSCGLHNLNKKHVWNDKF